MSGPNERTATDFVSGSLHGGQAMDDRLLTESPDHTRRAVIAFTVLDPIELLLLARASSQTSTRRALTTWRIAWAE